MAIAAGFDREAERGACRRIDLHLRDELPGGSFRELDDFARVLRI